MELVIAQIVHEIWECSKYSGGEGGLRGDLLDGPAKIYFSILIMTLVLVLRDWEFFGDHQADPLLKILCTLNSDTKNFLLCF